MNPCRIALPLLAILPATATIILAQPPPTPRPAPAIGIELDPKLGAPPPSPAAPTPPSAAASPDLPERLPNGDIRLGGITLHRETREISFPANLQLAFGTLEVLIARRPEGRLHETLLATDARPIHLQTLLILLGLTNGSRLATGGSQPQGDLLDINVEWQKPDGTLVREPVENWVRDNRTNAPMKRLGWAFVGTTFTTYQDADGTAVTTPDADAEGNLVLTYSSGSTILDSPDPASDDDTLFTVNDGKLPIPAHPPPPPP
ncbi:MAG: YdjY domain-containing protein, partial [Lentisphaeria bacterium]